MREAFLLHLTIVSVSRQPHLCYNEENFCCKGGSKYVFMVPDRTHRHLCRDRGEADPEKVQCDLCILRIRCGDPDDGEPPHRYTDPAEGILGQCLSGYLRISDRHLQEEHRRHRHAHHGRHRVCDLHEAHRRFDEAGFHRESAFGRDLEQISDPLCLLSHRYVPEACTAESGVTGRPDACDGISRLYGSGDPPHHGGLCAGTSLP